MPRPEHVLRIWFHHARESQDPADWPAQGQEYEAETRPILQAMDPIEGEDPGPRYRLTERTCAALLPLLERMRGGRAVSAVQSATFELVAERDPDNAEWFVVEPTERLEIHGSSQGLIEVRADRIRGRIPLRRYSDVVLASQAFVDFVRERPLTGIDFIWAPDKGKYAATQWYSVIGTSFLGRGVDHPWFDPAKRGSYKYGDFLAVQPTDPRWIIGVREFDLSQARNPLKVAEPAGLAEVVAVLRGLKTKHGVNVRAPLRPLRANLPKTDFAYARIAEPIERQPYRAVRLCCSAATRRTLLHARMAQPGDFQAVDVVDQPPQSGGQVFDRTGEAPPPGAFDAEQLAKVRATETKALAKHHAKPKPPAPVKAPELKKLLAKLKRVLKKQDAQVAKGATAHALAAAEKSLPLPLPPRWKELLSLIDGFTIDNTNALDGTAELRVPPADQLLEQHNSNQSMMSGDRSFEFPRHYLGVASSDIGDGIFLDTSKLTPDGDCPILHVDHETLETVMTWPAIGLFLADAIEVSDDE